MLCVLHVIAVCQTSRWLSRAETIQNYLSVRDLAADGVTQAEEDTTSFVTCESSSLFY